MKQLYTLFLLCAALVSVKGQHIILSDSARISLMTVAPGEFIYSTFGHSAIRVRDQEQRFDRCFNYGTFDFDQPNFVLKFCRGKLLYNLDVEPYRSFEYGNLQDRRYMQEQLLNLTKDQKQRIFDLLQENYKEENRYYKYDFFYDNCATRIRDIFEETFFHQLQYDTTGLPEGLTMRNLLHLYLKEKQWLGFGMDLVLGIPADKHATAQEYMFLPDFVHDLMGKAKKPDGEALVLAERKIPEHSLLKDNYDPTPFERPLWVLSFVALLGLLSMANSRTERIFDTIFWLVLGLGGWIVFLLWFATDHSPTKVNLNIFWMLPTHLFFFYRNRETEWLRFYFMATGFLAAGILLFWQWLPQEMPVPAIPIILLIVIKSLGRRYRKKSAETDE